MKVKTSNPLKKLIRRKKSTVPEQYELSTPAESFVEVKKKVYIVFYSLFDEVYDMAKAIKEGVDSVDGCQGVLYQVSEYGSHKTRGKVSPPARPHIPVVTLDDLATADGILFGFPSRFGCMSPQMTALFNAIPSPPEENNLLGKPAGVFMSVDPPWGGQESSMIMAVTRLVHHGMIFVPTGYSYTGDMSEKDKMMLPSPWGASCLDGGDNAPYPTELEVGIAKHQGVHFATQIMRFA